jgi:hypothetical protein
LNKAKGNDSQEGFAAFAQLLNRVSLTLANHCPWGVPQIALSYVLATRQGAAAGSILRGLRLL